MVTNPGLKIIIFRASNLGHGRLYENQAKDFKNPCSALPRGLQSENLIIQRFIPGTDSRQAVRLTVLSLKQLQTTEKRRCTQYFAQVKTNYNFFHEQTLLVPCFHLFLLMPQTVQSLSTPEKRNEGTEHSSPQLPPRSPQYSRWRLNAGEFITGLFSVCGNTPSLKLYFTNTPSYAKLKKKLCVRFDGRRKYRPRSISKTLAPRLRFTVAEVSYKVYFRSGWPLNEVLREPHGNYKRWRKVSTVHTFTCCVLVRSLSYKSRVLSYSSKLISKSM